MWPSNCSWLAVYLPLAYYCCAHSTKTEMTFYGGVCLFCMCLVCYFEMFLLTTNQSFEMQTDSYVLVSSNLTSWKCSALIGQSAADSEPRRAPFIISLEHLLALRLRNAGPHALRLFQLSCFLPLPICKLSYNCNLVAKHGGEQACSRSVTEKLVFLLLVCGSWVRPISVVFFFVSKRFRTSKCRQTGTQIQKVKTRHFPWNMSVPSCFIESKDERLLSQPSDECL